MKWCHGVSSLCHLQIYELDLSTIVPCCSGPKRPHDRVAISDMKTDFTQCLSNKPGFKVSLIILLLQCKFILSIQIILIVLFVSRFLTKQQQPV